MTGTTLMAASRRPVDTKLSEALVAAKEEDKAQDGFSKVATLVKAPEAEKADTGATMRPNEEQLSRINQFTKKVVTAEEVVCFPTLSCNDLPDRDDDRFTTECVKGFAELPQPYSPVGKSFLVDHNYSMGAAKGRIFGVGLEKIAGATFLTNEVYVPNTEKNKGYIEDIDFGVAWAVSVGVMLGKKTCSVCGENFYYWFCEEGHEKGLFYEKDGDRDKYGWPVPVDPKKRKGAVKCVRDFDDPRDMYELSQVILGAQYGAQLADKLPMEALAKSAKDLGIPTIGLSTAEADEIPFKHEPKRVSDARRKGLLKKSDDGSWTWTDDGMVFSYDPDNPEEGVSSLGRANNKEASDGERDGEVPGSEGSDGDGADDAGEHVEEGGELGSIEDQPAAEQQLASGEPGTPGSLSEKDGEGDSEGEGDDDDPDPSEDADDPEDDDEEETDPESSGAVEPSQDEEEKAVTKQAVMACALAHKASLPESVEEAIKTAQGNGLDVLVDGFSKVISDLRSEKTALEPKAALGTAYMEGLRKAALDWYVKARQTKPEDKVSIDSFEKLLNLAFESGDDTLLKSMIEEQKELAQAKFPKSVRRSSFPTDPNVSAGSNSANDKSGAAGEDEDLSEEGKRARRRHA